MALDFADGSGDRVNVGNAASLNNLAAGTVLIWCNPDTLASDHTYVDKVSWPDGWRLDSPVDTDAMRFELQRNNGNNPLRINSTNSTQVVAAGVQNFLGVTWDIAGANAAQRLFYGRLDVAVTEADNYIQQTIGAGAQGDDSAVDCVIATNQAGNPGLTYDGKISWVAIWNIQLTMAQVEAQRHMLFEKVEPANCVGFWHLGWNGTGVQPDWSGYGNNGAVTGATVASHVPLGLPVSPIFYDQPAVAAVVGKTSYVFIM